MTAAAEPLGAPILKVDHHGSRFGSCPEFLSAVGPRVAAVSVGARDLGGHPSPATFARLDETGARI